MPTEADHVAAWRHLRGSVLQIGASVVLAAGLCFWLLPGDPSLWSGGVALAFGLVVGGVLAWRLPHHWIGRERQEGLLLEERVDAVIDRQGIEVVRGSWRSQVAWSGVERIVARGQHVFVHLSDAQAIAIPRRCLGDGADQAAFVARLCGWRGQGEGEVSLPEPDPGRDHLVLRFRLVEDDYVVFSRASHATRLDRRPLGWALMGLLTGGVLVTSAEPWRGPVDGGLLALMVLFAGLLTAMGLAPLWVPRLLTPWLVRRGLRRHPGRMPSGQIVLGVGPAGGWLGTRRGVSRFGWREVRRVHSDADQVLVLFSDQLAVIVPARVFEPASAQDAFVARIQQWRSAQPWREARPAAPVAAAQPPTAVPDPFAPPAAARSASADRGWLRS